MIHLVVGLSNFGLKEYIEANKKSYDYWVCDQVAINSHNKSEVFSRFLQQIKDCKLHRMSDMDIWIQWTCSAVEAYRVMFHWLEMFYPKEDIEVIMVGMRDFKELEDYSPLTIEHIIETQTRIKDICRSSEFWKYDIKFILAEYKNEAFNFSEIEDLS